MARLQSVIVAAKRTPFGRLGGPFRNLHSHELAAPLIRDLIQSAPMLPTKAFIGTMIGAWMRDGAAEGVKPEMKNLAMRQNPAREALVEAGYGSVNARTVNDACSSGLIAIIDADCAIRACDAECVLAGGMEIMSGFPDGIIDSVLRDRFSKESMRDCAERCAQTFGISREDQDTWALASYRRAHHALMRGIFENHIVQVAGCAGDGGSVVVPDEQRLRTIKPLDGCITITGYNASKNADGAAGCCLMEETACPKNGAVTLARIVAHEECSLGLEGWRFTEAQTPAIRAVLKKAGLALDKMDVIEMHAPFAASLLHEIRALKLPAGRVNRNGDAISFGHPVGATGAKLVVGAVHELKRLRGHYALVSTCHALGGAAALIIENVQQ